MLSRNIRSISGFVLLGLCILFFRVDHGSFTGVAVSSIVVFSFWYLNGLNLAFSNLRNLLMLSGLFGVVLLGAQLVFPTLEGSAKVGHLEESDFNPALIAHLKESHEIALQLYLDHAPTDEDRYYKLGQFPYTQDGFHYVRGKTGLELKLLPKTSQWVQQNLKSGNLDRDLKVLESWFQRSFTYTLNPGALKSSHPMDEFLFQSEQGFCEHYAAAVATILKLRGNRAQVVVGYSGGSWNPLLRRLTFEDSDAHAWVEVVDPAAQKWRVVDPTSWVMTTVVSSSARREWGPWITSLALVLFISALIYFFGGQSEAHEALLRKLSTLERKNRLESVGLTISERISRLASLYPKRAVRMQATLRIYLASYFQAEPNKSSQRLLRRSLGRW